MGKEIVLLYPVLGVQPGLWSANESVLLGDLQDYLRLLYQVYFRKGTCRSKEAQGNGQEERCQVAWGIIVP